MLLRRGLAVGFLFFGVGLLAQSENDSTEFKTYYFREGGKSSEGWLVNGEPNGYWKSYYRNGNLKSEGNRKDFALDSIWKFYNTEGELSMAIGYKEGLKHGQRKTYQAGILKRSETFVKDTLKGPTINFYPSGKKRKVVQYSKGKPLGEGYIYAEEDGRIIQILTFKNGDLARKQNINRYDKQEQKQGLWVTFFNNMQKKVEGSYQNNLKHGYWKYYTRQGDLIRIEKWIRGELQQNASETVKINIEKKLNPQTGKLAFKGAFKNGEPSGVHRYYDENGEVDSSVVYDDGVVLYIGIIDDEGRKQGYWQEFYRSGELKAEGYYKNNKKVKEWKYYFRNGSIEQRGSYITGLPEGTWKWYYPDGMLRLEEEYVFGVAEGMSTEYSDTGSVIAQGEYLSGMKEGQWEYVLNDHRERGSYFEGLRNGEWKHFYRSSDQLRFSGTYENGIETGVHTYYYPNGQIKRTGNYLFGKKDGLWEYYTQQGVRIITIEYEEDKEIKYNGEKITYGKKVDRELTE